MALASESQDSHATRFVAQLARQATGTGVVPEVLALDASRATLRRFTRIDRPLTASECARMRAYFWAVVRGQSIRSRGAALRETRSFYLLLSVAEDLKSVGRAPSDIVHEIEAEYSGDVATRVMDRVRLAVMSS